MDTIRELFYGNIHPFERDVCPLLNLYILLISKCMFLRLFSCFLAFDISHFNGFCSIFGDILHNPSDAVYTLTTLITRSKKERGCQILAPNNSNSSTTLKFNAYNKKLPKWNNQ